jgi:adenylate cyclase
VLFSYLTLHLSNHALGLISLPAMEAGRLGFLAVWRHPIGTTLLYTAFVTHFVLALSALWQRRTLRMPFWEALRLVLGLSIPFLVVPHIVGTRIANVWFGSDDPYARVAFTLWHAHPELGLRQLCLVVIAWTHVCLGLHYWLRLQSWYRRVAPLLFAGALLLPVLSLLGFADAGQALAFLKDPARLAEARRAWRAPTPAQADRLAATTVVSWWVLGVLIGGVLVARLVRNEWERRASGVVRVRHGDRRTDVIVPVGTSVLEASRIASIPHASVCGGRGRCSTCRVQVVRGLDRAPRASEDESRVLRRIDAAADVRLACQLRPTHDVTVLRLLPPDAGPPDALTHATPLAGDEQDIAVFFADLRQFTRLAERKLPYDVVFFLNRYFEAVGKTIEATGGVTNQFTGDGVMALFGVGAGAVDGARRALEAAREVVDAVARLSDSLSAELDVALRIGIGIHAGPVVVGRMGYGEAMYLTAVGDTVHVASRLQDLTKEYDCQLVISEHVAALAGIDVSPFARHEITLRNRVEPLAVRIVQDVRRLAAIADASRTPS